MSDARINYAWPVTSENAAVYRQLVEKIGAIERTLAGKRVFIFGAGIRGCCIAYILQQRGLSSITFCDNNREKQGHRINEYEIVSLDEALRRSGERVFLVSPENSGAIGRQLTESGLGEGKDWFSFDISTYDLYVEEYLRPVDKHVLVSGDCAFTHVALSDAVMDSLGDMMQTRLGREHCKVLSMAGLGQQAQYHIIRSLLDRGERPGAVLLLVMEALTPKAHLMPRTQHPELLRKLLQTCEQPEPEFTAYLEIAEKRFGRFQVESFASFKKEAGDTNEKLFMQMNYLFTIREETEGVAYLKKTIRFLNAEGIPIVLYVPPVNYMLGETFFGAGFRNKYEENFTRLYEFLNRENLNYRVADASFLLSADEFAARNTIDETSNYAGRRKLLTFLEAREPLRSFAATAPDQRQGATHA